MSGPQSFSLWLLQIVALAGLLVFFLWLSLRPSAPIYAVAKLSVANDSTASFVLDVSNDNRVGAVFYGRLNLTLYFRSAVAGSAAWPPFRQGHGKSTRLTGESDIGRRTQAALVAAALHVGAELKVGVAAAVRYKIAMWQSGLHGMEAEGNVPIGVHGGRVSAKREKIELHYIKKKLRLHS